MQRPLRDQQRHLHAKAAIVASRFSTQLNDEFQELDFFFCRKRRVPHLYMKHFARRAEEEMEYQKVYIFKKLAKKSKELKNQVAS